jgi:hypothetical protein
LFSTFQQLLEEERRPASQARAGSPPRHKTIVRNAMLGLQEERVKSTPR